MAGNANSGRKPKQGLKLTVSKVTEIKRRYFTQKTTLRKLGLEFGVSHQTLFLIVNGAIW